jgi:hypothetical protein
MQPSDDLDRTATYRLGRVAHTSTHFTDRHDPAIVAAMRALDLASYSAVRSITNGPWPVLKPGQDPRKVRDSDARNRTAWALRDQISHVWSHVARATLDHIWDMPCADAVHGAIAVVITSAARHGAITASWSATLHTHNRSGHAVATALPVAWIHYVNGYPYTGWDDARAAMIALLGREPTPSDLRDDGGILRSRHEYRDRPGCPRSADPYPPHPLPEGSPGFATPWVAIAKPVAWCDRERTTAAWHLCCALARRSPNGCTWEAPRRTLGPSEERAAWSAVVVATAQAAGTGISSAGAERILAAIGDM